MSETISATATLLWPLIVLLALAVFRRPLLRVIRTAENRDLTVKVGGEEVSLGQLSQQHTDLITDLQEQVSVLRQRIDELEHGGTPAPEPPKIVEQAPPPEPVRPPRPPIPVPSGVELPATPPPWERLEPTPATPASPSSTAPAADVPAQPAPEPTRWTPSVQRPRPSGVLWVDDHPENHAVQLDRLQRNRVLVDTARSTGEALEKLSNHRYQLVVSDMSREENGRAAQSAGLDLVRAIRSLDQDTPIAIYANGHAAQRYGREALTAGANLSTGSSFELFEELRRLDLLPGNEISHAEPAKQ